MKTTLKTAAETKKAINGLEDVFSAKYKAAHESGLTSDEFYELPEIDELCNLQRELEDEFRYLDVREIKSYCNQLGYTDVYPYEVVRVISDKTVEVRAMGTKQTKFPQEFSPGGFVGHYADNRSGQKYEYFSNEENPIERVRWSEANRQWQIGKYMRFSMSDTPYKFHDYNF